MKANVYVFWHPDFPRLNDCMVTKQMFCIVLLRWFSIKFRCFVSTVGFSNEDNFCQLQGIGKLIKEKLLQKAVANCVWMLVVKIEGIEKILLEHRFTKETCLPFSMSKFPQFIITSNVV